VGLHLARLLTAEAGRGRARRRCRTR
jgi:hypothetical protein